MISLEEIRRQRRIRDKRYKARSPKSLLRRHGLFVRKQKNTNRLIPNEFFNHLGRKYIERSYAIQIGFFRKYGATLSGWIDIIENDERLAPWLIGIDRANKADKAAELLIEILLSNSYSWTPYILTGNSDEIPDEVYDEMMD